MRRSRIFTAEMANLDSGTQCNQTLDGSQPCTSVLCLQKYPLDNQVCRITLETFVATTDKVLLEWHPKHAMALRSENFNLDRLVNRRRGRGTDTGPCCSAIGPQQPPAL